MGNQENLLSLHHKYWLPILLFYGVIVNWLIPYCVLLSYGARGKFREDKRNIRVARGEKPYSKMMQNTLFFCLHVNWSSWPRLKPKILLNSADAIKVMRANKHKDQRIMYFPSFWNVYSLK